MTLPTSNLRLSAIATELGEIPRLVDCATSASVNQYGLNPTYCPGDNPNERLANLQAHRRQSYFKGYNHAAAPGWRYLFFLSTGIYGVSNIGGNSRLKNLNFSVSSPRQTILLSGQHLLVCEGTTVYYYNLFDSNAGYTSTYAMHGSCEALRKIGSLVYIGDTSGYIYTFSTTGSFAEKCQAPASIYDFAEAGGTIYFSTTSKMYSLSGSTYTEVYPSGMPTMGANGSDLVGFGSTSIGMALVSGVWQLARIYTASAGPVAWAANAGGQFFARAIAGGVTGLYRKTGDYETWAYYSSDLCFNPSSGRGYEISGETIREYTIYPGPTLVQQIDTGSISGTLYKAITFSQGTSYLIPNS